MLKNHIRDLWRKLTGRPRFRKLNEFLFDCSVRGLGLLNHEDQEISGESYFLGTTFRKLVKTDSPFCIDVGANRGNYTEALLKLFPKARVLGLEPHPGNFGPLKERLGEKVDLVQCAAGAEEGELTLYDRADAKGEGSSHASLYREVFTELRHQGTTEHVVRVRTLDNLLKEKGITEVDLLKIDTEGHELEVLHGCKELIEQRRVRVIQIEFNEMNVIARVFLSDFRKLLPGYRVYRLLPKGMIKVSTTPLRSELFAFQNIVFIRDDKARK